MTIDRDDIARRHQIRHLAGDLVGETAEEIEADAAAKAAIMKMFGSPHLAEEPEPPIEGLAARDKPVSEYSDAERAAQLESLERTVRARAERDEQRQREAQAEADRTDEQLFGDALRASGQPGAKAEAQRDFLRSIHRDELP